MAYARIEAEKTRLSRMRHTFKEERRASARHAVRLVCDRQGAEPLRCAVYVPDELPPQRASELRARGQFELHGRVITWLKEDVSLIASASESEQRAQQGFPADYMTRRRSLRTCTAVASHRRWIIPSAKRATMAGRKPCGKR